MKTVARTRAVGGSLIVTIPKEIVNEEGIREGELIQIDIEKAKKSFYGALKGMKPYKREKFSDFD